MQNSTIQPRTNKNKLYEMDEHFFFFVCANVKVHTIIVKKIPGIWNIFYLYTKRTLVYDLV